MQEGLCTFCVPAGGIRIEQIGKFRLLIIGVPERTVFPGTDIKLLQTRIGKIGNRMIPQKAIGGFLCALQITGINRIQVHRGKPLRQSFDLQPALRSDFPVRTALPQPIEIALGFRMTN